jgi:glutaconate CoA-transferase subunit A
MAGTKFLKGGGMCMKDKRMSLSEAIAEFVKDSCLISHGGIDTRSPYAAACEMIRQGKKDLHLVCQSSSDIGEMLIGAGCIRQLEAPYLWMSLGGSGHNYRRAAEKGIPNHIVTREYSNLAMSMRFLAGSMGIPFMATKSLLGSDVIKANPDIKVIPNPFGHDQVALVSALQPDVAIIHVQRADMYGNAQIWGVAMCDEAEARAAKKVIITCEEIIPTSEIRKIPNMTSIPSYCVDAVVHVPFGSHPTSVTGYYWTDQPFRKAMATAGKTREGFLEWLNEWVLGVKNHDEYLKKLGKTRLDGLAELEHDNYQIPEIVKKGGK